MARPAKFEESDQTYVDKREGVGDLATKTVPHPLGAVVWSCWELDEVELAEVLKTGRVWLGCVNLQPAVIIMGTKPEEV